MRAFFCLALLSTSAFAQEGAQVVRPELPSFIIGHQQSVARASILEEVPKGETVHQWTRMVTTQRFGGVAGRTDAPGFLTMLANGVASGCQGAVVSRTRLPGAADGVRLDCPRNPQTGLPETFIARAIVSGADLHVFQVAWRRVPTAEDLEWGQAYLAGIRVTP